MSGAFANRKFLTTRNKFLIKFQCEKKISSNIKIVSNDEKTNYEIIDNI